MSWSLTSRKNTRAPGNQPASHKTSTILKWPVRQDRRRLVWFPARQRLIGLVRGKRDCFVLPPAVVRKATWRD